MKLREKSSSWSSRRTSSSTHCARSEEAKVRLVVEIMVHGAGPLSIRREELLGEQR